MSLMHLAHAAHAQQHFLLHEREKQHKKLEEQKEKLGRMRERLHDTLKAFNQGRQVKISGLSRAFLKQAVTVSQEKKKLHLIKTHLENARKTKFAQNKKRAL